MKNDEVRYRVQHIINCVDDWLDLILSETDPAEDFKKDPVVGKWDNMQWPYEAGVYKARAASNADKLKRIKENLVNEFKEIGVQSRTNRI